MSGITTDGFVVGKHVWGNINQVKMEGGNCSVVTEWHFRDGLIANKTEHSVARTASLCTHLHRGCWSKIPVWPIFWPVGWGGCRIQHVRPNWGYASLHSEGCKQKQNKTLEAWLQCEENTHMGKTLVRGRKSRLLKPSHSYANVHQRLSVHSAEPFLPFIRS